jgi:hypothetical protein
MAENYSPPEGFITMGDAQNRLGVSKVTIVKIVREASIPIYRDPRNKRVRLLKANDISRLEQPVLETDLLKAQAA